MSNVKKATIGVGLAIFGFGFLLGNLITNTLDSLDKAAYPYKTNGAIFCGSMGKTTTMLPSTHIEYLGSGSYRIILPDGQYSIFNKSSFESCLVADLPKEEPQAQTRPPNDIEKRAMWEHKMPYYSVDRKKNAEVEPVSQ